MKIVKKLLIIILVLIAPIFVFLFLKSFGSNEFKLPIYYEEGNPTSKCNSDGKQHTLSEDLLLQNDINLPALIYFGDSLPNKNYSDLATVLEKYPKVSLLELSLTNDHDYGTGAKPAPLDSLDFIEFINCELVLGEGEFLTLAVANKYVLIDTDRRIRGYYQVTDLEDIERLDVELDILLNY